MGTVQLMIFLFQLIIYTNTFLPSLHFDYFLILSIAVAGDVTNIILDPLFMFVFRMGISGAAIAHVISQ